MKKNEGLPKDITYIKNAGKPTVKVGLGVLEQIGVKYYYIRYVYYLAGDKRENFGWIYKVPKGTVTLLDGHHHDMVAKFHQWEGVQSAWKRQKDSEHQRIDSIHRREAYKKTMSHMDNWRKEHPEPSPPDFLKGSGEEGSNA